MKSIDFNRVSTLLDVVAKVVNVGPMNQPILGEAQAELNGIVADCEANRQERADKIRAEEQVAQQKTLEAQAEQAEEQNAAEERQAEAQAKAAAPTTAPQPELRSDSALEDDDSAVRRI